MSLFRRLKAAGKALFAEAEAAVEKKVKEKLEPLCPASLSRGGIPFRHRYGSSSERRPFGSHGRTHAEIHISKHWRRSRCLAPRLMPGPGKSNTNHPYREVRETES